jgi:hypothetical protein
MKKIISFSIFNNRPKDVIGLICNCILVPYIYPGWTCRIYYDNTVSVECINVLKSLPYTEFYNMTEHWLSSYDQKMWRFLAASDKNVDVMISRDADSWISKREFVCVEEWLKSDKIIHIIRDHCYHSKEMMAGMWGIKKNNLDIESKLKDMVEKYKEPKLGDQPFLKQYIYDKYKKDCFVHTGKQFAMNNDEKPWLPGKEIWKTGGYFTEEKINLMPEYEEWDEWIYELSFKKINNINKFLCAHCRVEHEVLIGNILENYSKDMIEKINEYFIKLDYDIYKIVFNPPISII